MQIYCTFQQKGCPNFEMAPMWKPVLVGHKAENKIEKTQTAGRASRQNCDFSTVKIQNLLDCCYTQYGKICLSSLSWRGMEFTNTFKNGLLFSFHQAVQVVHL